MFKFKVESRDTYYDKLCQWWREHKFPVMPKSSVPTRIFVVYVEEGRKNIDLYALPVWLSDSDMAWLGFPTSNRNAPTMLKEGALEFLMDKLETCLRYEGVGTIITTSDTPKLMQLFKGSGFTESDQGTNYYTKQI